MENITPTGIVTNADTGALVAPSTPSTTSASSQKAADGVSKGCGGECQKEITGQCCKYQSEINAYCQKVMTPYSDKCSSCGGSGISGGPESAKGASGSSVGNDGISTTSYNLCFIYNSGTMSFTASYKSLNSDGSISSSASSFTCSGLVRLNNTKMELVTTIYISIVDCKGISTVALLNILEAGDLLTFRYNSNFLTLKYITQIDNGNNRELTVEYIFHFGNFSSGDIVNLDCSRISQLLSSGIRAVVPCPYCGGTGLEGSGGKLDGVIMAVYNGSAGFAGVTNVDIYGIVQPS